jgi:hypothetical protein
MYAKATKRPAIRKINQVLESGKKTRERRTPKTSPRTILTISTDERMLSFTKSVRLGFIPVP